MNNHIITQISINLKSVLIFFVAEESTTYHFMAQVPEL